MITNPTPNSTAENIKKKNVKESKFKLSYTMPINNVKAYKVIQRSSAVNNRCNDVLTLIIKVLSNIKKRIINKLISPKNIINSLVFKQINCLKVDLFKEALQLTIDVIMY